MLHFIGMCNKNTLYICVQHVEIRIHTMIMCSRLYTRKRNELNFSCGWERPTAALQLKRVRRRWRRRRHLLHILRQTYHIEGVCMCVGECVCMCVCVFVCKVPVSFAQLSKLFIYLIFYNLFCLHFDCVALPALTKGCTKLGHCIGFFISVA